MTNVVIVDAVRTPVGRRGGGLSSVHPADLLATVQSELVARTGIDPAEIGQVVGGCAEPGRRAELQPHAGRRGGPPACRSPCRPPPSTPSAARASRPPTSPPRSVGRGRRRVGCGVEVMSRIPIGSSSRKDLGLGIPIPKTYFGRYEMTSLELQGADANRRQAWGLTRDETWTCRAGQPGAGGAGLGGRIASPAASCPSEAPDLDENGKPAGTTHRVAKDQGLRRRPWRRAGPR